MIAPARGPRPRAANLARLLRAGHPPLHLCPRIPGRCHLLRRRPGHHPAALRPRHLLGSNGQQPWTFDGATDTGNSTTQSCEHWLRPAGQDRRQPLHGDQPLHCTAPSGQTHSLCRELSRTATLTFTLAARCPASSGSRRRRSTIYHLSRGAPSSRQMLLRGVKGGPDREICKGLCLWTCHGYTVRVCARPAVSMPPPWRGRDQVYDAY